MKWWKPVGEAYLMSAKPKACGSEPARESGGSVSVNAESAAVIASKLAPTGVASPGV
ncbi:protein of unknown function [Pseudomonas mediterranea]